MKCDQPSWKSDQVAQPSSQPVSIDTLPLDLRAFRAAGHLLVNTIVIATLESPQDASSHSRHRRPCRRNRR